MRLRSKIELIFKTKIMKLELKHLAPYLPYCLSIRNGKTNYKMVSDASKYYSDGFLSLDTIDGNASKPMLRPLSDLINIYGYHFIYDRETDAESIYEWIKLDFESKLTSKFSYEFWALLFENHFDVFGLIEQDLAIDINTI